MLVEPASTGGLAPPAVTALKDAEGTAASSRRMERTMSEDIRGEREDLREAAEETLNVILDLSLTGTVRWVSPSWQDVIGTPADAVVGKPIRSILIENDSVFDDAVESMKKDDSRSQIVRFLVKTGPLSKLAAESAPAEETPTDNANANANATDEKTETKDEPATLLLEGQGIMVYDRSSGGESHTMWMIRPPPPPREITIDLPPVLVESLGVGAEMLAQYMTSLAETGTNDPASIAPPLPVLCRICERQIPPWWFEKHSDLCLQEHSAEMEVQMAHEGLTEQRNAIVRVLDALEARMSRPTSGENSSTPLPHAEYKGFPIGPSSTQSSGPSSGTASPSIPSAVSRETSATGMGHSRGRSFAMRRPLSRIVELVLDLCDTALEINTSAIKESPVAAGGEMRTQSPQSESRISQVLQWQSPSSSTIEQEQGLSLLCQDTESTARAKVDAVLRHRRILEYSERIRIEFTVLVQDCIDEAMRKAAKIAAGQTTDSSDEEKIEELEEEPRLASSELGLFGSLDGSTHALSNALRSTSEASTSHTDLRRSSTALSARSSSPKECPTPRSHRGTMSSLGHPFQSKRSSIYLESDAWESDSSVRSSIFSGARRAESPGSEQGLSRATSARERHRRSMILPGAASPRKQSPARNSNIPPASPLRVNRPRFPESQDVMPSPITSPILSGGEFSSPLISARHHRRQSSTASSDVLRPPGSPRLASVSQPQARAVPPSIKDFEIIKPISKGAFGSVYLSKKKSTGDYFAIKVLKKTDMIAKNQVTNVKAERAIMMWQGESEFVAKLYWTFSSKDYLYLVMEYLNGGDCASLIKVLGGLPEEWAKKYLGEVVLGVEHLHGRGIVHRDLKPDNLLIDQHGHLKLTDFGLSRMGLIGRQKHALNNHKNESAPDLLKHGPFARAPSMNSSRSTSLDLPPNHSPSLTPQMTPDMGGGIGIPSYFSLSRENTLHREHSRHASGHRSESGGSESLQSMFNSFTLNDPLPLSASQRRSAIEEERNSEGSDTPEMFPLHAVNSQSSAVQNTTPPQPTMMPPSMALFDPEDSNRRFVGTPDYLAPETINGVGQDELSDWWSLGCIMFEFLYGYPPFHADTPEKVFANILNRRIDWPDDDLCPVSAEAKDLMNKLMSLVPQERLGANLEEKFSSGGEEVRKHPWFDGLNWETLLQDEAEFVPVSGDPENTEYFDPRGATLKAFTEELEDQASSPGITPGADYVDRPHDALSKVRTQVNSTSMKRGLMPLHIPPHVRQSRSRRVSESLTSDDFGSFAFKNLPVLDKANKDVLQKLKADTMSAQTKHLHGPTSSAGNSPVPSLEGSPMLQMPLNRHLSTRSINRPASPSTFSQTNSSPSRISNPTSPLLVSFSTGQNTERRKTSSTSSTLSHSASSLQSNTILDAPRIPSLTKANSVATSPIKHSKAPPALALSPHKTLGPQLSRTRSHTVGSQEGETSSRDMLLNQKRRSGVFDMSPSSSDNEDSRASALLRVQRRRQSSRRLSRITLAEGPIFRPLDVLICEDHPVSRMVMEKLLEKLRCRTITVGNGPEAMRYGMSEVKFDIILMEFKLPQINGADVARMIRDTKNANRETPIVAVTGYLKELQAPHHFDAMIEKPPTTAKLVEVLSRFCQWRPPPPGAPTSSSVNPPSGLRQETNGQEGSPSSLSSGYVNIPGGTFQGSSREDSLSSSFFGDSETTDDASIIIHPQSSDDWPENILGISEEPATDGKEHMPHLIQQSSAPPALQSRLPVRQRSAERIKAKREVYEKRAAGGESGDDEDEELGDRQMRTKSPQGKTQRGSKLGIEMMRTDSRGSVVYQSEPRDKEDVMIVATPELNKGEGVASVTSEKREEKHFTATTTPPEIFPPVPGHLVAEIDMDATPKPQLSAVSPAEEPTPRAKVVSSRS